MTFTAETKLGTLKLTIIQREVANPINPECTIRQFGLGVQAPWQAGPTIEWYNTAEERDIAEYVAVQSYRMQA
jgi:hypothetical protein